MKTLKKVIGLLICAAVCCPALLISASAQAPEMPEAFQTGFIDSNGASIEYALYGVKNGEAMVLISGNGSDMHGLDGSVLPYLAQHFMVITFSNRGTGNSTRGDGALTFDVMAQDMLNVLDYLGVEKTNIFGFSDGGNLALVFTVAHRDRVKTLVPMSANINPFGTKIISQIGICSNYFWKCVNAKITGDPQIALRRDIQGLMVWQPTLRFSDLKTINVPTLNIYGEHDMIKRSHSQRITKSIPGAQELMIIGGGHGSCFEQTESVIIPALYEFYSIEQ